MRNVVSAAIMLLLASGAGGGQSGPGAGPGSPPPDPGLQQRQRQQIQHRLNEQERAELQECLEIQARVQLRLQEMIRLAEDAAAADPALREAWERLRLEYDLMEQARRRLDETLGQSPDHALQERLREMEQVREQLQLRWGEAEQCVCCERIERLRLQQHLREMERLLLQLMEQQRALALELGLELGLPE